MKLIKEILILVFAMTTIFFGTLVFRYSQVEKLKEENARLFGILNTTRTALIRDTQNAKNQNLVNYFNALGVGWNLPNVATKPDTAGTKN